MRKKCLALRLEHSGVNQLWQFPLPLPVGSLAICTLCNCSQEDKRLNLLWELLRKVFLADEKRHLMKTPIFSQATLGFNLLGRTMAAILGPWGRTQPKRTTQQIQSDSIKRWKETGSLVRFLCLGRLILEPFIKLDLLIILNPFIV